MPSRETTYPRQHRPSGVGVQCHLRRSFSLIQKSADQCNFELADQTRTLWLHQLERRKVGERDRQFDRSNLKDRPGPVIPARFADDRYAPLKRLLRNSPGYSKAESIAAAQQTRPKSDVPLGQARITPPSNASRSRMRTGGPKDDACSPSHVKRRGEPTAPISSLSQRLRPGFSGALEGWLQANGGG